MDRRSFLKSIGIAAVIAAIPATGRKVAAIAKTAYRSMTASQITNEALKIIHGNMKGISSINRQYDDKFLEGSRESVVSVLRIRLPNKYKK